MNIEVRIIDKIDYDEKNSDGWSLPIEIDDFILHPNEVEFEWKNGDTLPYNDFIFYGADYYYRIYINGRPVGEWEQYFKGIDVMEEIDDEVI